MENILNNAELKNALLMHSDCNNRNMSTNINNKEHPKSNEFILHSGSPDQNLDSVANNSYSLQPGSNIKPNVTIENIKLLLSHLYGMTITEIKELMSYDDRNYFIYSEPNAKTSPVTLYNKHDYIFKIVNKLDSKREDFIDAQTHLLLYLLDQNIKCPRPITNVHGAYYTLENINGENHIVRLLEYIPGKLFHEVTLTNFLLFQSGQYLARLVKAFKNFQHVAYDTYQSVWQLQSIPQLKKFLVAVKCENRRLLIESIIESFDINVLSQIVKFGTQIIHGDFNEQNIIVQLTEDGMDHEVIGVIDFGDSSKSPMVFEVGIALTYMILQAKCLKRGGIFLAGFESIISLTERERQSLKYCVAARLAQSLVMGVHTHSLNPHNEYVLHTQAEGWKLIDELWTKCFKEIDDIWETAGRYYINGRK